MENIYGMFDFSLLGVSSFEFDQYQFVFDVGVFGQVYQFDYFDEFVELFGDLFDDFV